MERRTLFASLILSTAAGIIAGASTAGCVSRETTSRKESLQPPRTTRIHADDEDEAPTRKPPSFQPIPIADPSGEALDHFHAALRSAEDKRGQARILIYGASHTAADVYPDVLRRRLQQRFGEAGTGFVMPAKPRKHYSIPGVAFERSIGWSGFSVKASAPKEDLYGLAGMYLLPKRRHARSVLVTRPHAGLSGFANDLELFYWKQPGGGHFKLTIDDKPFPLSASGKPQSAYRRWSVPEGSHRIELVTRGDGPVRIFGLSVELKRPGVVVDTLGIPGARASTQLLWDESLHREHLRKRRPDLVILAYGTNEAGDDDKPIELYRDNLRKVLTRIRDAVPKASCVLVGPSDRPIRQEDGSYVDRPRTAQVVEIQRQVSFELGCGFFDVVSFMGGAMSMLDWCDGEPPFGARDHIHFTQGGYRALGNVLHDALMAGYDDNTLPALIGGREDRPEDASEPSNPDAGSTAADGRTTTAKQPDAGDVSAATPDTPQSPSAALDSTSRR